MEMSTEQMFVPALASLDGLVPHDGVLSPAELAAVARAIGDRPELWSPLIHEDVRQRRYELAYEDDRMDAWILSWMPGQATGFHDHDVSSVGLCVVRGQIIEDQLVFGGSQVSNRLAEGSTRQGEPGYIHRIGHAEGTPAVTVHVYSPRLERVGQYRLDHGGVMRREIQPGRLELTGQAIIESGHTLALERF